MTNVLPLSQLPEGHTHQLEHAGTKVLLTNVEGTVYAVESKCSHFGLPLENAALCGHRLRCPFHHACFDVRDGKQLEAPGMDGLTTFAVEIRDGAVYLSDEPDAASKPSPAPSTAPDYETFFDYAIVGGGIAAANAVDGIREFDQNGSIVLLTREDLPPYDRTHVSKALLDGGKDVADLPLRSEKYYAEQGVDLRERTIVSEVNVENKTITILGGDVLTYKKVLLATGGRPRQLDVPGSALNNVHLMRRASDAEVVRGKVSKGTKVVIVGGSFIGLEAAMSLGKQGGNITVVAPEETLFEGPFGKKVGDWIQRLHEAEGVRFQLGRKVEEITGEGTVSGVKLDNGDELAAEIVVVGIGVIPETRYLIGLAATNEGGVKVDNHLEASAEGVWVAGDIARYPDREGAVRIEHWKVAAQQGRVAGRNMAGANEAYTMVPYFWSNQQGTNIRYVGHATDYDEIVLDGTPGEGPFIAFYLKGDHCQAALGVKRDADIAAIGELMNARRMPANSALTTSDWAALLAG
ncbi:Rieske 2Fe-2S domain-containing protein [Neolewinella aurantiaca]|uniref:Rieske 2Fe-2S domain-containing protein n=1 Tax=Neolewinella aurantiaca TaxID=2602767 RepID=A0A5C7FPG0_9BACT|nr:FAD-dependent oxidoreductase [Neolewinella aurantiaca]TXF87798.1 Rieske 2Fe-2S domain-containing protein [Neolewinella aurantiaca]